MKNHHANVIVADPPWKFRDTLPGPGRDAISHYKTLELSDIMRFPLPPLEDDALLVLWRVASQPQEALDVVKAWGFTVKSEIVWVKTKAGTDPDAETDEALDDEKSKKMGMGHYVRNEHEVALVCARGKFKVHDRGVRSTFRAPLGAHSEKPAKFFALVERLAGPERAGHLVELFGRKPREGWHVYGDELPEGYVWTPRPSTSSGTILTVPTGETIKLSSGNPTAKEIVDAVNEQTCSRAKITAAGALEVTPPVTGSSSIVIVDPWKNAAALAAMGDDDAPFSSEIVITGPQHMGEIAGPKAKRVRGPGKKNKKPGPQDAIPTIPAPPPSDRGALPDHVVAELGQHPALTEEDRRAAWVAKAEREGIVTGVETMGVAEAWILLQYRAPKGFFAAGLNTPAKVISGTYPAPALQAKDGLPGENIGQLCNDMAKAGAAIPITMLCAWSVLKRDLCRSWIAEGGKFAERPDFVDDALAQLKATGATHHARKLTGWDKAHARLAQWDGEEEVHP